MKHRKTLSFLPLAISLDWAVSQQQPIIHCHLDHKKRIVLFSPRIIIEAPCRVRDNLLSVPLVSWCHHPRRSQDLESVSFCGELVQIKTLLMISQINCKNVSFPTKYSCSYFVIKGTLFTPFSGKEGECPPCWSVSVV